MSQLIIFSLMNRLTSLYVNTFFMAKVKKEIGTEGYLLFCIAQYLCSYCVLKFMSSKGTEKRDIRVGIVVKVILVIYLVHSKIPVYFVAVINGIAEGLIKRFVIVKKSVLENKDRILSYHSGYAIIKNFFEILAPICLAYLVGEELWKKTTITGVFAIVCVTQLTVLSRIKTDSQDHQEQPEKINIKKEKKKIYLMLFAKGLADGLNKRVNQVVLLSVATGSVVLGEYKSALSVITIVSSVIIRYLVKKKKINRIMTRISSIVVIATIVWYYSVPSLVTLMCYKLMSSSIMKLVELLSDTKSLAELNKQENIESEKIKKVSQFIATVMLLIIIHFSGNITFAMIPLIVSSIIYTWIATEESK